MAGSLTQAQVEHFRREGYAMGFGHVESGPLVRSSYHAFDAAAGAA